MHNLLKFIYIYFFSFSLSSPKFADYSLSGGVQV